MFSAGVAGTTTAGTSCARGAPKSPPSPAPPGGPRCVPQCDVHWLHAGGAGEGAHEPVVNAAEVVEVHAREEADGLANNKLHHAYWTPAVHNIREGNSITAR